MSPVEIAKAFDASLLRGRNSNADIDALIKEVGGRSVRYGSVSVGADGKNEEGDALDYFQTAYVGHELTETTATSETH